MSYVSCAVEAARSCPFVHMLISSLSRSEIYGIGWPNVSVADSWPSHRDAAPVLGLTRLGGGISEPALAARERQVPGGGPASGTLRGDFGTSRLSMVSPVTVHAGVLSVWR